VYLPLIPSFAEIVSPADLHSVRCNFYLTGDRSDSALRAPAQRIGVESTQYKI
jgi:hypothetical protein